jgi:hypothetical protein
MPRPTPIATSASSSTRAESVAAVARRDSTRDRGGRSAPIGSASTIAERWGSGAKGASIPGRTVAICGRVRERIGATMLPPNAGFHCTSRPSWSRLRSMQSPVSPRPSRAATRGNRSRPK